MSENNLPSHVLGDKILANIKQGSVKMRSRWYFVARDALIGTAIVIVLLIAVYLGSFIIFVLHETGAWFVPVFGLSGWWSLFNALPWVLITLTVIFTVLLAYLARRYGLGHQWPIVYSLLAAGFLIAAASFIGIQTSIFQTYFTSTLARDVPLLGQYYPGIGILAPNDIHRGQIIQSLPGGFLLKDVSGLNYLWILVSSSTAFPGTAVKIGDSVVVVGAASATGTVRAVGIQKLEN
jgi:hypothetical protein